MQQIERTYVRYQGRKLSYFSGCDYFRLASHPRVHAAVSSAIKTFGLNVAASRVTSGNHELYEKLESQLSRFFGTDTALLAGTGYAASTLVTQALAKEFSHALLDESAHPALADAAQFLECPVLRFKHCEPDSVAQTVERCGPGAKLILLTDGMFPADGSVAPLKAYRTALPRDAVMLVDDAHAAGVVGASGKGSLEHAGLGRKGNIQTITLSKAFGVYGGVVLGSKKLRSTIVARSHLFAASTPLPLPLVAAASVAVQLVQKDKAMRQRLSRNTAHVKQTLTAVHPSLSATPGPILSLVPTSTRQAQKVRQSLLEAAIYPPFLHYPGTPEQGLFRFALSSEHTRPQLDNLLSVLISNLLAARFTLG